MRRLAVAEEANGGGGGGLGWFILGGLIGLIAGAYIASGPGRGQVDNLRSKTIELSGSEPVQKAREAAQRARHMVTDPDHPVGKAIQDGVAAAKRERAELKIPASTAFIPVAKRVATTLGGQLGLSLVDLDELSIALTQACDSAINAAKNLDAPAELKLNYFATNRALVVDVDLVSMA